MLQAKPWSFSSIPDFFKGLFSFVTLFFTTLVGPGTNKKGEGYSTDYRSTGKSELRTGRGNIIVYFQEGAEDHLVEDQGRDLEGLEEDREELPLLLPQLEEVDEAKILTC